MRRKDISYEFTNINSKFIEESASYKTSSKKYIKFLAIAACLAIIITAIPVTMILNRERANESPVVTTPVIIDNNTFLEPLNIIYCNADSISKKEEIATLLSQNIEIREFVSYHNSYLTKIQELEYSNDIPEEISVSIGNKIYNGTFESVYICDAVLSTNDLLKSYAKVASYVIDNPQTPGLGKIFYRVETKEILGVSSENSEQLSYINGSVTEDEIKALAERDLINLYGSDIFSKYNITIRKSENDRPSMGHGAVSRYYMVSCERVFGEFKTSEKITLIYNTEGELLDLITWDLGVFDIVEGSISEKLLLQSEANALKIYNGKLVHYKQLEMGIDGIPYMYTLLKYAENDTIKSYSIYYQINNK